MSVTSTSEATISQNTNVLLAPVTYNRSDYTALRAHCLKIPIAKIADLYYSDDSPQVEMGLERFLLAMRADLIERCIVNNPATAEILQGARQGGAITSRALEILIKAADAPEPVPHPNHPVSQWFRPLTAKALKAEHIYTLADLTAIMTNRGPSWWRGLRRIGVHRAKVMHAWVRRHESTLGTTYAVDLMAPPGLSKIIAHPENDNSLAPIERLVAPSWLDGSEGINRDTRFNYIGAANDLEAINNYLHRFRDRPNTLRAYTKEIERFLFWCILELRKPLSSVLVPDCESYKDFLKAPTARFVGIRAPRESARWRPFSDKRLSPASQKQAVLVVKIVFEYLVGVRYLAGNPWFAVDFPKVPVAVNRIQIEKALAQPLWDELIERLEASGNHPERIQERVALAMMLLLGDSGLRRAEVASAQRIALLRSKWSSDVFELTVLGKRNAYRVVPVSSRTVEALRRHWKDRGLDFDSENAEGALLGPVVVPGHAAALARHREGDGQSGYTTDGLYKLFQSSIKRLRLDYTVDKSFSLDDLAALSRASPHALRHTFGTLAVADGMPIDVAQAVLGHKDSATTAIYVQAKTKRVVEEGAKYFAKKQGKTL
jgi:site-specific recombinase XerD